MNYVKANKVVRVRVENLLLHTYEVQLTTMVKFRAESLVRQMSVLQKTLMPYRWYELQRFITIPAYRLLSSFPHFATNDLTINKKATTAARSIIVLIWGAIVFFGKELIKAILPLIVAYFNQKH